jgi:hypothetical protein
MRGIQLWVLAAAMAVATWAGGWSGVPLVAFLWGAIRHQNSSAGSVAAAAACIAWLALLLIAALQGPILLVADMIGGIAGVPAIVSPVATLIFAAGLGWSAAEVGSGVMKLGLRQGFRASGTD